MKKASKKRKLKDFLTGLPKKQNFYFCLTFLILNAILTRVVLETNGVERCLPVVLLVELALELAGIMLIAWRKKKNWTTEKVFVFMVIPLGLMFIALLPPGQSPDELNHFRRAYGIASGAVMADKLENGGGSALPIEISDSMFATPGHGTYAAIDNKMAMEISGETSVQKYPNTAIYNFVSYLPQTFAALIGKVFNMPFLAIAYLMEAFNFITWAILVYLAIKLMPKFKKILLFVVLNPMTLQEATSLSADALAIGLSIFMIAFVCYLAYSKKTLMTRKELIILYVLAILIGLCKIVYAPLVLMYLIIPYERFGSKKKKWIHAICMGALFVLANFGWLLISSSLETVLRPGVDAKAQAIWILKNPFEYLIRVVSTVNLQSQNWLGGMLGLSLGAFNINLPTLYFLMTYAIFVIILAQRSDSLNFRKNDRLIFGIAFVIIMLLICTSVYLQWTDYGEVLIEGVQGRYIIPILMLLPLAMGRKKASSPHMELITEDKVLSYNLFFNVMALVAFFSQNW